MPLLIPLLWKVFIPLILSHVLDVKHLLSAVLGLIGYCEATITHLKSASPEFVARLLARVQPLVDGQLLIGVESLLSSLNVGNRKSSSASARAPNDTQLHYLIRISERYTLEGHPPGALNIQGHILRVFEHVCYVSCPIATEGNLPRFLPLKGFKSRFSALGLPTLQSISELSASQLASIEASADFLKFKTSPHQDLSLSLKATSIRLACISFIAGNEEPANLPGLIKSVLLDSSQMVHDDLSLACLDALAAISMNCQEHSGEFNRSLRNYIVHTHGLPTVQTPSGSRTTIAAQRLAWCLSAISNDRIVSTLYTLVNVIAPSTSTADRSVVSLRPRTAISLMQQDHTSSAISLSLKSDDQRQQVYSNVIEAIAAIVCEIKDEKIAELMISLLGQKFGRVNEGVDKSLVWGLATISKTVKEKDFRRILKLHARVRLDPSTASISLTETVGILVNVLLIFQIMDAHQYMAKSMEEVSPYREILLTEILNALIEVYANNLDPIQQPNFLLLKYFQTLAEVLPEPRFEGLPVYAEETVTAFRNMWFACVIHGVHPNTKWVQTNASVLRKVAANSPLLTLESTTNDFDADLELNPVLNRMKEGKHPNLRGLEEELKKLFPNHASDIKNFDHSKLVFIGAVTLVETLRSESGRCSLVLDYFDDANLEKSDSSAILKSVVEHTMKTFLDLLRINSFEPSIIALGQRELKELLIRCCDPVLTVQSLAQKCCDRLISTFPALLCFEGTTYALLELLTLLWEGCLSQETDLVSPYLKHVADGSTRLNSSSDQC